MSNLKKTACGGDYDHYVRRKVLIIIALVVLTFLTAIFAISAGSADIPMSDVLKALFGFGASKTVMVTVNIRLPRILMAIVAGFGLAAAGCVMQSILKNPLASASTLGISQGASFGAAIAIVFFGGGTIMGNNADAVTVNNPYLTSFCAFAASMFVTFVILGLSKARKASPETMILAGVALSSLFAGATALLQYLSSDVQLAAIVFWTFGDLGRASMENICVAAIVTGIALIYFMFNRWNYNALECGEHTATGLGVNVSRVRLAGMTIASLTAATIVSFVGIINFIGLIAPHIMRRFVGNDYRFLLPASALMGALMMLLSDTFARLIVSPVILPIGAITSFLGAPLFLYLIFKGVGRHAEN